jgi:hypothetical protein
MNSSNRFPTNAPVFMHTPGTSGIKLDIVQCNFGQQTRGTHAVQYIVPVSGTRVLGACDRISGVESAAEDRKQSLGICLHLFAKGIKRVFVQ